MKKAIVFAFVLGVFGLQGCNNKSTSTDDVNGTDSLTESVGAITTDTTQSITAGVDPVIATSPAQSTPVIDPNNTGKNPAHGEPGHRCDIDVGAPLNSPPGKSAPSQPMEIKTTDANTPSGPATITPSLSTPQPSIQTPPTPVTQPGVTLPGMNPPHGEPGHDCAIPVGSPLKK